MTYITHTNVCHDVASLLKWYETGMNWYDVV